MARSQDWLRRWSQLADAGDPDAQIVLGWEHATGKIVEKDFDRATALFRAAELQKPAVARLYLAKAKILNNDETFSDEIRDDCDAGFGPALYVMGTVEERGIFRPRNL